jgi:hypothetical protein
MATGGEAWTDQDEPGGASCIAERGQEEMLMDANKNQAKKGQEEPGGARRSQEEPGRARRNQEEQGRARRRQERPRKAKGARGSRGARRRWQEDPGEAKKKGPHEANHLITLPYLTPAPPGDLQAPPGSIATYAPIYENVRSQL